MSYIDKVQVKGTDYDIQDSSLKNTVEVQSWRTDGFRNNIINSTSDGGVFNSFRNQFKSTVASTTSITISTGAAMKNGLYYSSVDDQTFTIPLASSGNMRKDIIAVRWDVIPTVGSTQGKIVRIAGTEATKTGSLSAIPEPSYNTSAVNVDKPTITTTVDLPLYKIIVDGTNGIAEVDKMFSPIYDNSYLSNKISELDTAVNKLNTDLKGMSIYYEDYGAVGLSKGDNKFYIPPIIRHEDIYSIIVQYGEYMLPSVGIRRDDGEADDSYMINVAVPYNDNSIHLISNTHWETGRRLYVLFFLKQ